MIVIEKTARYFAKLPYKYNKISSGDKDSSNDITNAMK